MTLLSSPLLVYHHQKISQMFNFVNCDKKERPLELSASLKSSGIIIDIIFHP